MTDSHDTFPNNNLYLLWKQRELCTSADTI